MKRTTEITVGVLLAGAAVGLITLLLKTRRRKKLRKNSSETFKHRLKRSVKIVDCVETSEQWRAIAGEFHLELETVPALGLDCEWVTDTTRQPVALLQLATQTGRCVLIRLRALDSIPDDLRAILRDRSTLKVGVGIHNDAKLLLADHQLETNGCVDLRNLAARSRKHRSVVAESRDQIGLRSLCESVLGKAIEKDSRIRCGDWESEVLTPTQIEYAANDAFVAVDIFTEFVLENMTDVRSALGLNELRRTFIDVAKASCQGIVDVKSVITKTNSPHHGNSRMKTASGQNYKPGKKGYSARKTPLYHNCQLQAPDGQLLCTCDLKKAEWYIYKGLGVKVNDDPLIVRLNFEPSGRPQSDQNYYLNDKENICVVCGRGDSFIRKNVIPHEYRKFFPALMKSHRSHDVLLLCVACHRRSAENDSELRLQLAERCRAPIGSENTRAHRDRDLVQVQSAAKALLRNAATIPETRLRALRQRVAEYYDVDGDLSDEFLGEVIDTDANVANEDFVAHGRTVVEFVARNEGLIRFERDWRQHFLDSMQPKYLPAGWSVDHSHHKLENIENQLTLNGV